MESSQISLQSEKASKPEAKKIIEDLDDKIDNITQFASKAYFKKALKKLAVDCIENASRDTFYIEARFIFQNESISLIYDKSKKSSIRGTSFIPKKLFA